MKYTEPKIIKININSKHWYLVGAEAVDESGNPAKVLFITECRAQCEGDKWFYDIFFSTGGFKRYFVFESVCYSPQSKDDKMEQLLSEKAKS